MNFKSLFGLGEKRKKEIDNDKLVEKLGFSEEVIDRIKEVAATSLQPLEISDLYNYDKKTTVGLSFLTLEEKAERLVVDLQSHIKQLGYLAFINERNYKQGSKSKIGIIKGNDQFELLKILQTNGDNYDISNDDVILKLKQWNNRYPFIIIGADFDWVEAKFTVLPLDREIKSFAKEMYEFCPDVVDQGTGSIEELIEEMKETNKLYLWWD
ncbi:DUF4253 domain-containing protein [Neobacillus notoginsengisoli]|uniref:DUF4253 domain-containing protein n=1 Tax=Neobacillus notoginsengisoli TaxID=1578198 RepID=A0A417Z062_9BACI|nr:DUF4253 domain-containing protein [Neobacillus notoginsengisoli]RHW43338.1 DUF4253 domain-containing protein [Neobacillus notoginsengisoli]